MDSQAQSEGVKGKAEVDDKQESEVELRTKAMVQHSHNHSVKNMCQRSPEAPRS